MMILLIIYLAIVVVIALMSPRGFFAGLLYGLFGPIGLLVVVIIAVLPRIPPATIDRQHNL